MFNMLLPYSEDPDVVTVPSSPQFINLLCPVCVFVVVLFFYFLLFSSCGLPRSCLVLVRSGSGSGCSPVRFCSPVNMSGFNLLHLITKSQPVALKSCSLPSGARRTKKTWPVTFSREELKERLSPMQYHVTQERGTESAFTGEFTYHKDEGTYTCVVCGAPLFSSNTKFDSGSGWPSFFDLLKEESISNADDFSYGMHRVETTCSQCGAHLGHMFDDGPRPTGKRYCINSASLAFQPKQSSPASASAPSSSSGAEGGAPSKAGSEEKTEL